MRSTSSEIMKKRQCGATAVEFALISLFLFTLLLGIVELGRLMYVWNTVQEVTRKAAREAVVRNFATARPAIQREAIFRAGSTGAVTLPAGVEISNAEVKISYLNANRVEIDEALLPAQPEDNLSYCGDALELYRCIRYVRAEVCIVSETACTGEVQYRPLVGFLLAVGDIDFRIGIPVSPVEMPAEGLGFTPS